MGCFCGVIEHMKLLTNPLYCKGGTTTFGKKCNGCGHCVHANRKLMKCFPESKDCAPEYNLEEDDFNRECECDFYEAIKK